MSKEGQLMIIYIMKNRFFDKLSVWNDELIFYFIFDYFGLQIIILI